jgi:hypothetical protein
MTHPKHFETITDFLSDIGIFLAAFWYTNYIIVCVDFCAAPWQTLWWYLSGTGVEMGSKVLTFLVCFRAFRLPVPSPNARGKTRRHQLDIVSIRRRIWHQSDVVCGILMPFVGRFFTAMLAYIYSYINYIYIYICIYIYIYMYVYWAYGPSAVPSRHAKLALTHWGLGFPFRPALQSVPRIQGSAPSASFRILTHFGSRFVSTSNKYKWYTHL